MAFQAKKSTQAATNGVSIRLDNDPEFAAAEAKLGDLHGREAALAAKIETLADAGQEASREDQARAIVRGEPTSEVSAARRRDERRDSEEELAILRRAVAMQDDIVEEARLTASRALCAKLWPQHLAAKKRQAELLVELAQSCMAEIEFFDRLRDTGVRLVPPLSDQAIFRSLGLLNDTNSKVVQTLIEFAHYGFIDGTEDFMKLPALANAAPFLRQKINRAG